MREDLSFVNPRGNNLSGILNNGRPNSPLLIFVHGFAGDKDENGLFIEAEQYFSEKGFNTFRFDLEGVGDSEGDFINTTLESQVADLQSAIDNVSLNYSKIGVVGFSLGAALSILTSNPKINFYSFWSPAINLSEDMFPRYNTPEVRKELADKGYLIKAGLKVGPKIIHDFQHGDFRNNLRNLGKSVLLVHGTQDPRIDYRSTVDTQKYLSNSSLRLIKGANHSYKNNPGHRKELFDKTYEWIKQLV